MSMSAYSRLNDASAGSRSASPVPMSLPPQDDAHYAYSTSLRRHDSDGPTEQGGGGATGGGRYPSGPNANYPGSGPVNSGGHYPPHTPAYSTSHPYAHTVTALTPSSHYATLTVPTTLSSLGTHPTQGLASAVVPAVRELAGSNEFEVPAKDPLWKRFAGQFYESPLILLLLGSAVVSAVVGNFDDAASIVAAIVIVVTGAGIPVALNALTSELTPVSVDQLDSSRSRGRKSLSRHSTSWCLTTVI